MAGGDELAKCPPGRTERIKLFDREAAFGTRAAKVGKLSRQFLDNLRMHRLVDSWTNFDVAGIEANLPRVRRRNDDLTPDQFAPVHVISKRGRKQPNSVAALAEYPVGVFEN